MPQYLAALLGLVACALMSSAARAETPALDAATRDQVLDALVKQLNNYYVFPEVAEKIGAALRAKQQRGGYDEFTEADVFANVLTSDLRHVSKDTHLRVRASEEASAGVRGPTAAQREDMRKQMAARGYGVARVEILPGNVGYLALTSFDRATDAAPALTAAMTQLAGSDALIVDVRNNNGGDPATVAFLSSYLFDQRTHLNDLYWREGNRTVAFWTEDKVPGLRFGQQKAVYVLTGGRTFSAAEEFSYNLQQLKRATLIGETTGGGANPGGIRQLHPHFTAFIPNGRAINPISKTNWEGVGVKPDVAMPLTEALGGAHRLALEKLVAASSDPQQLVRLKAALSALPPRQ